MRVWSLIIKMEPVTASRPKLGRGRTYYAPKYSKFKAAAPHFVGEALNRAGIGRPMSGYLSVTLRMIATRPKKSVLERPLPDVDNYAKAVLDACNGIVWHDDEQIASLAIVKEWAPIGESGRIELHLTKHHLEESNIIPEWLFRAAEARPVPSLQ